MAKKKEPKKAPTSTLTEIQIIHSQIYNHKLKIQNLLESIRAADKEIKAEKAEICKLEEQAGPVRFALLNESAWSEAPLTDTWLAVLATEERDTGYYIGNRLYINTEDTPKAYMHDGVDSVFLRELETKGDLVVLIRGLGYEACGIKID